MWHRIIRIDLISRGPIAPDKYMSSHSYKILTKTPAMRTDAIVTVVNPATSILGSIDASRKLRSSSDFD